MLTVVAEASPYCGQCGRVCRVFWRAGAPWVLLRTSSGLRVPAPWHATDLPIPPASTVVPSADRAPVLLSPAALVALVHFLRQQAAARSDRQDAETSSDDGGGARRDGVLPRARKQGGCTCPR
jgi:hypothetical protein